MEKSVFFFAVPRKNILLLQNQNFRVGKEWVGKEIETQRSYMINFRIELIQMPVIV